MTILGVVAAGALLGVVLAELSHYLAMRGVVASCRAGRSAQGRTSEAVIVLGFPPRRDGRTNAVHRWRCRIAVGTTSATACLWPSSSPPSSAASRHRSGLSWLSWHVRCLTAGAG
jgi:hypothetical protein